MRLSFLTIALLTIIFATVANANANPPDKGYRRVKQIQCCPEELTPRFAEYDNYGCVDLFDKGGNGRGWSDFAPAASWCYNLNKDTVSFYHERGFMTTMWLYPGADCTGKPQHETDWSACQPKERNWNPRIVKSFRMT